MDLPDVVARYFWGDDLTELSIERHGKYIAQVLLDKGNTEAVRWLFTKFSVAQIKTFLPDLKLSKKSAQFWSIYLS
jgi:hypothetical protein